MAVHASHAALPYPIKGARFSMLVPLLDADGDPTVQTTPDTEISEDNAAATAAAEEVSATSGMDGMGLITFTGAETDCSTLAVNFKAASGPKATLATIYPRTLVSIGTGTLSAGSAGGGTLGTLLSYSVEGCFIKTTGGTGGGGTGGANNQARKIVTYNNSTGAFTVSPNWETTPDNTTEYELLLPEGISLGMLISVPYALDTAVGGIRDVHRINGQLTSAAAGITFPASIASPTNITSASGIAVSSIGNDVITAASIAAGAIDAATFAADVDAEFRSYVGLASANLDTQLADVPTVAEFEARTPSSAAASNMTVVYATDFATNYDTTNDRWTVNVKTWNDLTTVALPLVPTVAGRSLDVSTGGEAGIDWGNVGSKTTANNLSNTTISSIGSAIIGIQAGGISAGVLDASALAEIADAIADEALSGHSTAGTWGKAVTDILDDTGTSGVVVAAGSKSGYTISGTITTLDALDTAQDTQHSTTQTAVADVPTNAELATALITALTTALTEGYRSTGATGSVRDLLYELLAHVGEFTISGTTKTLKKLDGATTAKTSTLNDATTPTGITETT